MRNLLRVVTEAGVAAILLAAPPAAFGQGLNVDLDVFFGPPESGNGAPSDLFPGAAGQPGRWNRISATGPGPFYLYGLEGNPMGVVLTVTGGWGSASGSGFPNTGDFALPTNDGANVGSPAGQNTYNLSGVAPGPYLVYCYAVNPGGYYVPTTVVIEG